MLFIKVKAGALQFVVLVGVLLAIMLLAFISLTHVHNFFNAQSDVGIATIKNADNGIFYALQKEIPVKDSLHIVLEGDPYEGGVTLYKKPWGIYYNQSSTSQIKRKHFVKSAFVGGKTNKQRPALVLADQLMPLVVVGNTRVEGDCLLPSQGVRTGNIAGVSYYGNTTIYGKVRTSATNLPDLEERLIEYLESIHLPGISEDQNHTIITGNDNLISVSFKEQQKILYSPGSLILSQLRYIGNILIKSDTKITVDAGCTLTDVLLVAPEIEIKDGFSGRLQAIAAKKIDVGKEVHLKYPSALVLKEKNTGERSGEQHDENAITLGKRTIVEGVLLNIREEEEFNFTPQIVVDESAVVKGEVYCQGNLELKGKVSGTVYTRKFIARQNGSVYQNHIYNGQIIAGELPEQYVGLQFDKQPSGIAKWVY